MLNGSGARLWQELLPCEALLHEEFFTLFSLFLHHPYVR
ncbi:MAG: hypothetical protein OJF50_002018 [Nitrospira sp.]|nr:hypothetical protein [Nitrospira sp.]